MLSGSGKFAVLLAALSASLIAGPPTITTMTPSAVTAGGGGFTLVVDGAGFMDQLAMNPISAGSDIYWNQTRLPTTFVSSSRVTAPVTASLIASAGSASITVANPIQAKSNALTLTINAALAITTTDLLQPGAVDLPYSQTLGVTGGSLPRRWSLRSGNLPPGLGMDATSGAVSGMPTAPGTFAFEAQVTDNSLASTRRSFSLRIHPALVITTPAGLPGGTAGTSYGLTLAATGGLPPYRWSIRSGELPPGVTLDAATGRLTGTPSGAGTFSFTVHVSDSLQATAIRAYSIAVDSRTAVSAIVNGAAFLAGPVAPGTIVTIFGTEIGPATAALLRVGASGVLDTTLGGARVFFDGLAAPLIYAQANQVSAIVPFGMEGRSSTEVTVELAGLRSRPFSVSLAESSPALFTVNSSGKGPGAILNQDYSLNSAQNPARKGSIVMLYATGGGQTDPPGIDGQLAAGSLARPRLPVSVTMGGLAAEVRYAGAAPGLVAGVLQLNVAVPEAVAAGDLVSVFVRIGNAISQPDVSLAVR